MDELIKQLMEKTDLDEQAAQAVVPVVMEFFKDKLPNPIADQLDDLLEGKLDPGELLSSLASNGGILDVILGMLGIKR